MTDCERCKDVHRAQELGMTNKPCECDCHPICPLPYDTGITVTATVPNLTNDVTGAATLDSTAGRFYW